MTTDTQAQIELRWKFWNDLDGVEGLAVPGRFVELWVKQRNFREGTPDGTTETFGWCAWKNGGCYTTVSSKMGYRIQVDRVTHGTIVTRGNTMPVTVDLRNVGWSRMFNNQHWASDVITGAAIGTFSGLKVVHWHHQNPRNFIDRTFLGVSATPTEDGSVLALNFRPPF